MFIQAERAKQARLGQRRGIELYGGNRLRDGWTLQTEARWNEEEHAGECFIYRIKINEKYEIGRNLTKIPETQGIQ